METKEIKVYKFDELSEFAKDRVLKRFWDINVDEDWWDYIFEEAKEIGLEITRFDLHYELIEGNLIKDIDVIVQNVKKFHSGRSYLYKIIERYSDEYQELMDKLEKTENWEDAAEIEEKIEALQKELLEDLLNEYFKILKDKYEYLTSEEDIAETIRANEYLFTEDGELIQ
jgi:hypothetical protein